MDNFEESEQIEEEENLPLQPSSKRKYLLIGVITALTVLIGGGILLLLMQKEVPSQVPEVTSSDAITQDETADWQTYHNEEFGFEVKYPLDLSQLLEDPVKISKDNIFTARVTKEPNPNITGPNSVDQGFFIRVFEKDNRTLESFFDDHSNLFFPLSNGSLISLTRDKDSLVTVLNKDQRTIAEANMVGLFDGDSIIVAVYSFYRLNDTTFNQILSTFRFIDEKESLKIDSNVVWGRQVSVLRRDCPSGQAECVSSVMKQNNASEEAIEFFIQTGWFADDFQEYGMVDLITLVTPWRVNSNNDYMLVNERSSFIIIESEVSGDLSEKIENYQLLSSVFPEYTLWGTDNWFIEQRDQSFLFGFDIKDERGCHACSSGYIAIIAFQFDSTGNYEGMEMLQIKDKTNL